jgi:hypothetical protein
MVLSIQLKNFFKFCKLWDITHNTGIPYNPQGQAIVEQQHQKIKIWLLKIKKGEFTPKSPHTQLHLIPLILKFFSLDHQGITTMEKHFHAWNTCPPVRVLWKNLETNTWQGPNPSLTTGRRYACVFPEHERWPRWLPVRCIKPVTAFDGTHEETLARQT